jgi:tellurite resistance protein TehA-like permease
VTVGLSRDAAAARRSDDVALESSTAAVGRLRAGIRSLSPGYFALVMATGIVSVAMNHLGLLRLSATLLVITGVCWLVLAAAYCWRAVAFPRDFLADARSPAKAFAFFTVVAGSDVLAARLIADGHRLLALALGVVGALAWLALSYVVPLHVITAPRTDGVLAAANGTWLVWVVATQSLSIVLAGLLPLWPAHAADVVLLAVAFWGVGVVLYLIVMTVVLVRLLMYPVRAADLTPPYWISMGATAITVLAGVRLLGLASVPVLVAAVPVVTGLSIVLWAFGTWLWPPLLSSTVRRAVARPRTWPSYQPALWSMIFPFGMYAVCSMELGAVVHAPWIRMLGKAEGWFALLAWTLTFLAMLISFRRRPAHVG